MTSLPIPAEPDEPVRHQPQSDGGGRDKPPRRTSIGYGDSDNDELRQILRSITDQPGIVGAAIVGFDGVTVAENFPNDVDSDLIAILGLGIFINTSNSVKRFGHNHVHQIICQTPIGFCVIADFGGGALVALTSNSQFDETLPFVKRITHGL